MGREYVMLTFPCPALNINFFPSDIIFYNTFNKLSTKDWGVNIVCFEGNIDSVATI